MKTYNAFIYHCLFCGNVVRNEMKVRAPLCCGKEMAKAAAETIYDREEAIPEEHAGVHCEMAAPTLSMTRFPMNYHQPAGTHSEVAAPAVKPR